MVQRPNPSLDTREYQTPIEPPSQGSVKQRTKIKLDIMKANMQEVPAMVQDLLKNYKHMDKKERMAKIGEIIRASKLGELLKVATISWLFGKPPEAKAEEDKEKKGKKKSKKSQRTAENKPKKEKEEEKGKEAKAEEGEAATPTGIEKERVVVCSDARLICINTHPVKGGNPVLKKHSSWLLQYGLPDYDTFKKEMIETLAPDADSEASGIDTVTKMLTWAPMGKYQCMPKYLFPHVNLPYEGEEGLQAMWLFLQSEELQRKACRGYLDKVGKAHGYIPRYLAAAYYGGPDEIAKMKRFEAGQGSEKDKSDLEKKQKQYPSIMKYAMAVAGRYHKFSSGKGFDMEAMLDAVAAQESGRLEGKTSRPRDEKWENDERYARNRDKKPTAVA